MTIWNKTTLLAIQAIQSEYTLTQLDVDKWTATGVLEHHVKRTLAERLAGIAKARNGVMVHPDDVVVGGVEEHMGSNSGGVLTYHGNWYPDSKIVELLGGMDDGSTRDISGWPAGHVFKSDLSVTPKVEAGPGDVLSGTAPIISALPQKVIYHLYGFNEETRRLVFSCLKKD